MLFVGLHVKRVKELSDLAVPIIEQNIAISCVSKCTNIYETKGKVY